MFRSSVKIQYVLILFICTIASQRPAAAQDAKVCPDEPIPAANAPCPAVCNRGCEDGICKVYNPFGALVVLPDTMRSVVNCEGNSFLNGSVSCGGIIKCSERASCDIIVTSRAGASLGVDCGNTTHSCSVFCDALYINAMRCNATSACNCNTNCVVKNTDCRPGFTCLGDVCYQNLLSSCGEGVRIGTMDIVLNATGPCDCVCKNASLARMKFGNTFACVDPNDVCSSDQDCNFPLGGVCARTCKCTNPWGGRNCTTHMCPQCENSAFCGNSTLRPCVCTGLWTGENCTDPIRLTPSRMDIPENVARCDSTSLAPWSASPPQAPVSIPCPSVCNRCTMDTDGTPVCLIMLPIPGQFTTVANCPTTHRCIGHASRGGFGYFICSGPFACDFVCTDASCSYNMKCSSDVSCRVHCSNMVQDYFSPSYYPIGMLCQRPNGSCICDKSNCPFVFPCTEGASCNGDPCSSLQCALGKRAQFNNETGQCQCRCVPQLYELPNGNCVVLNFTTDCASMCLNGGVCKDSQCWCPPGYSGSDCSQRDTCVAVNTSASCPSACDWCSGGVCFYSLRAAVAMTILAKCPVGYPCVFICEAENCVPTNNQVECPVGSGPCELWCWDAVPQPLGPWFNSPRPYSGCTTTQLICEDGTIGCRARCNPNVGLPDSAYYGARTIRSLRCGSTDVTTRSDTPLDRCGSCGTDSCFIGDGDPCYKQGNYSSNLRLYGYLPLCWTDRLGVHLDIRANSSNQCECVCPRDMVLVNRTCVATGCSPPCQNFGVCEVANDLPGTANDTYRCRCFGGWTGRDCTSRCFFPVTANVTLCLNGLYRISGELQIPDNRNLSLYVEVPDLVRLEVEGSIKFSGQNATLSISPPPDWNYTTPTVIVSGDWAQTNGSTLQNAVIFDPKTGNFFVTVVQANGTVAFGGGNLELQLGGADLIAWIRANSGQNISITMFTYGSLGSRFDHISLNDAAPTDGCERLVSSASYSASEGSGKLDIVFSLDSSGCTSPQAVSEALGVNIAAIVVGVAVAFLAAVAAAGGFLWRKRKIEAAYAHTREKLVMESSSMLQQTPPMPRASPKWVKADPSK